MIILSASKLKKKFKTPEPVEILSDVSLEVRAGESIAITGRSGEGKTTLLHILGSLEPFDSGELIIANQSLQSNMTPKFRNRRIGFIFQAFNLLEDFTALENVLMPARIARQPFDREKGKRLLSLVGLQHRADFSAKLLSGGERQRVAIARALCNDPDLLFADEPSGNLDHANAAAVSNLLFDLVASSHKTLLLVTHDMELAARCDRKLSLCQGKLS
jgi:lipoprotein-releasing system ATP-binding protein